MTEDRQLGNEEKKVNTVGGPSVTTGGDFVGRDKIIQQVGKTLRDEQYQIVLNWESHDLEDLT